MDTVTTQQRRANIIKTHQYMDTVITQRNISMCLGMSVCQGGVTRHRSGMRLNACMMMVHEELDRGRRIRDVKRGVRGVTCHQSH